MIADSGFFIHIKNITGIELKYVILGLPIEYFLGVTPRTNMGKRGACKVLNHCRPK